MFVLMLHANANRNAERRFDIIRCEYGVLHHKTEYVHCDKVVPSVKELTRCWYPPSRFVKLPIDLLMKILFLGVVWAALPRDPQFYSFLVFTVSNISFEIIQHVQILVADSFSKSMMKLSMVQNPEKFRYLRLSKLCWWQNFKSARLKCRTYE